MTTTRKNAASVGVAASKLGRPPAHVRIANYPLLKDLCWSGAVTEVSGRHAFAIYERNWRFVDLKQMAANERLLLDALIDKFGNGVINA